MYTTWLIHHEQKKVSLRIFSPEYLMQLAGRCGILLAQVVKLLLIIYYFLILYMVFRIYLFFKFKQFIQFIF